MKTLLISLIIVIIALSACEETPVKPQSDPLDTNAKITFIELGSKNCIPCQNMIPVMDSIRKKYGSQVSLQFIDVLREPVKAEPYKIKYMPTQVFLDTAGIEIHRHIGFYPEDSIHVFLQSRGLKRID
jgi:thioredoxin 1